MATVTWQGDVDNNWSTAGNWDTGSKPANGDDVVINNSVNCVVDENTAQLLSFNMTGYTGVLSGAYNISVYGTTGTSVCKFVGSNTWAGSLILVPSAGTTTNVTFNGLTTCTGITVVGTTTGAVYFLDAVNLGATRTLTLTSGTLHMDGASDDSGLTHSIGKFVCTGSTLRALYLGACTLNVTGTGLVWSASLSVSNLTVVAGTSVINVTGDAAQFNPNASTYGAYNTVNFTGSGIATLGSGSGTFNTVSHIAAIGSKLNQLALTGSETINTSLILTGGSTTDRLLVQYSSLQSTRSFILGESATCRTAGTNNVDFRNIIMSGGAENERDLSALSVGDCGLNSGITFRASDDRFWVGGTGNWSDDDNHWATESGGSPADGNIPLPQDNVHIDNSSDSGDTSITADMPRLCRDIDSSVYTDASNMVLKTAGISNFIFGSVDFSGFSSITLNQSLYLWGSESTYTITVGGVTIPNANIYIQSYGGMYQLLDAFIGKALGVEYGTLDLNDNNITLSSVLDLDYSEAHIAYLGNGTITFTGAGNSVDCDPSNDITLYAEGSTIVISSTSASVKAFRGGGLTFNNLTYTGGNTTGILTIYGNNTFNTLTISPDNDPKVAFESGTTQNVRDFVAVGNASHKIILVASTPGSAATINKIG